MDKGDLAFTLMEIAKTLMLDEFEIVHWAKHIERFEF